MDNPFAPAKPDGKLTPERWRIINRLIGNTNSLQHDQILTHFCEDYGLSRKQVKATIKAFRLHSPPMLQ